LFWTDYIYAKGERIAKADLYDTRLHVSATTCNGCSGAYEVMNFTNIGDLNGHVIRGNRGGNRGQTERFPRIPRQRGTSPTIT